FPYTTLFRSLAFMLDADSYQDRQTIRDVCRITHRNDEAYIGALAIVRCIRHALAGLPCDTNLLMLLIDKLPDSRVRDRLTEVLATSPSIAEYAMRFTSSGYVVDSVPLAILAVIQATNFTASVQEIVQLGGDTDTIASMFGQIFGAANGMEALPSSLILRLDCA